MQELNQIAWEDVGKIAVLLILFFIFSVTLSGFKLEIRYYKPRKRNKKKATVEKP